MKTNINSLILEVTGLSSYMRKRKRKVVHGHKTISSKNKKLV